MTSILVSFVGMQDPFAKTNQEGSIATMIQHLQAQLPPVLGTVLLHTADPQQNAMDAQD